MSETAWPDDERRKLVDAARAIAYGHNNHGDRIARDNCGACSLRQFDYAGWLRLYIALGWSVPREQYDAELAGTTDNPRYQAAVQRDIATFGIRFKEAP